MQELFKINHVELSSTVYSEIGESIQEAVALGDWRWYGDLCIEAHGLLVDAGFLEDKTPVSVSRFYDLLWHCHLDAQVPMEG